MFGKRPGSGRPSSRFNPITGEETPIYQEPRNVSRAADYERPASRPGSRPQGVPSLELGRLGDGEPRHTKPTMHHDYKLDTPNTASTVSWGDSFRDDPDEFYEPKNVKQERPKPKDFPPLKPQEKQTKKQVPQAPPPVSSTPEPTERTKAMYTKYHQELVDDYNKPYEYERDTADMTKEELEEHKRKQKLLDTVLVDQLSRAVISDPEQDAYPSTPPRYTPGLGRGKIRHLHESKVQTTGTATEQLLSQRVRFGARVLSRSGHDALRELTGFFFSVDNTLTVYEFKQFGKSAKALPYIGRGSYNHVVGRRRGQPIKLTDIVVGRTLVFLTSGQTTLPDSVRAQPMIRIRITDVDNEAKEKLLLSNVRESEKDEVWAKLHMPNTQELRDMRLLRDVQAEIRHRLRKRGIKTVTGLGSYFRSLDRSGDGVLNKGELEKALIKYHIELSVQDFDALWEIIDENGDGVLDYGEFMRGFLGEMNEYRKQLVRKAFHKLDANKKGVIKMTDMNKFYNASKHPLVKTGEASEAEVLKDFLDSFEHCHRKGEVTYVEFEEYYEGLSLGIGQDQDFENVLRNSWGI